MGRCGFGPDEPINQQAGSQIKLDAIGEASASASTSLHGAQQGKWGNEEWQNKRQIVPDQKEYTKAKAASSRV